MFTRSLSLNLTHTHLRFMYSIFSVCAFHSSCISHIRFLLAIIIFLVLAILFIMVLFHDHLFSLTQSFSTLLKSVDITFSISSYFSLSLSFTYIHTHTQLKGKAPSLLNQVVMGTFAFPQLTCYGMTSHYPMQIADDIVPIGLKTGLSWLADWYILCLSCYLLNDL